MEDFVCFQKLTSFPHYFFSVQDHQTRITRDVKPRITASEDANMDSKYRSFFERVAGSVRKMSSFVAFFVLCGEKVFTGT